MPWHDHPSPFFVLSNFIFVEQFLSGMSQGPDPNDVPPVQAQAPLMTSGFANFQECQTIEEEDSSEYEDSSDEQ